jgi:hypothetical protein
MLRTAALLALCFSCSTLAAPKRKAHFGPPKEATKACLDAQPGTACSYELEGVKVTGTCEHAQPTELLSCQPPKAAPPAAK